MTTSSSASSILSPLGRVCGHLPCASITKKVLADGSSPRPPSVGTAQPQAAQWEAAQKCTGFFQYTCGPHHGVPEVSLPCSYRTLQWLIQSHWRLCSDGCLWHLGVQRMQIQKDVFLLQISVPASHKALTESCTCSALVSCCDLLWFCIRIVSILGLCRMMPRHHLSVPHLR